MMKLVVLSCMLAVASASLVAPLAYSAPFTYGAHLAYSAPFAYGAPFAYSAPLLTPYGSNYRGPLSLAPGQPANILAADGRPLDTLEVNLDRSAHLVSKALNSGVHLLKKRSVITPIAYNAPLAYTVPFAPLAYNAPLLTPYSSNYRGPLSLAPGQPANILGSDGRPLDTLEVNLDRSAHLVSKALHSGIHLLKKRSVITPLIAPVAGHIALAHTPLITPATPITRVAPIAPFTTYAAPYATYW